LLAFVLDLVLASLVTSLFFRVNLQDGALNAQTYNLWSAVVWASCPSARCRCSGSLSYGTGRYPGGALDGATMVGPGATLVRAALTVVILPAVLRNLDAAAGWIRALARSSPVPLTAWFAGQVPRDSTEGAQPRKRPGATGFHQVRSL